MQGSAQIIVLTAIQIDQKKEMQLKCQENPNKSFFDHFLAEFEENDTNDTLLLESEKTKFDSAHFVQYLKYFISKPTLVPIILLFP